jgi:phosphate-selective porin OprO/OprP
LQSELLHVLVNTASGGNLSFPGFYVQGSWFVTGETRPYRTASGTLGQVLPRQDVSLRNRTWGALELAARYSRIDLTEDEVRGGEMGVVMGGLNWYWGRYVRLMFNVGYADVDRSEDDGDMQIYQTRLQMQF